MATPETTSPAPMALWRRILEDPQLQDLPYKVETNGRGQIILTPRNIRRSFVQVQVADLVNDYLPEGIRAVEFAVLTDDGVKVPDVIWISKGRRAEAPDDAPASPIMPELIIEIGWPRDDADAGELYDHKELYFAGGAEEVWNCSLEGEMAFFGPEGIRLQSELAPEMPERLS